MNEQMQAIIQNELGGPEVLHLEQVDVPQPGLGEVRIRVHAAGINPADAMNRQTGVFSGAVPFTLGWDVSGTVDAVGPGVTLFQPGDEVFGLLPFPRGGGAYAEYVVSPTRVLMRKPTAIDHVQAAALPLAGLTAWQALFEAADVKAGTRVLVTAAAGGVGHLAVQIAKTKGAHVTAVVSGGKADFVRGLGADEVIDYETTDFAQAVSDIDVVLEAVSGDYPVRALRVLRDGGVLVSTLPQGLKEAAATAGDRVRVLGVFVEADRMGLAALTDLVVAGQVTPTIAAVYPLAEAGVAHATKHGPGKVVLKVR